MSDQEPMNRRRFFRDGLRQLLDPLVRGVAEPIERAARAFNESARKAAGGAGGAAGGAEARSGDDARVEVLPKLWLRPPGVQSEKHFLETCQCGGECVRACPVKAIRLEPRGVRGLGKPYIVADEAACAMCAELACMKACPSGALSPVERADIDMGVAVWRSGACLRTAGEMCELCVFHCPMGSAAIEAGERSIVIHPAGCTGCGMCQQVCPTGPRAVQVIPRAAREM